MDAALPPGIPVLGVNIGRLGYLTQVEPADLENALAAFLDGTHQVEERMTLEVTVTGPDGRPLARRMALNEATVEKTVPGHTVRIATLIDDRPFVTYAADGLLVSTPTGSTAYNLSARGPVLSPRLRAIVVTPVSPHMLFDRPLVLDPDRAAAARGARAPRRPCWWSTGSPSARSSRVPPSTAGRATSRPGWSPSAPGTSMPSCGPSSTWPTARDAGAGGSRLVELRVRNLGVIDDVTVALGRG